MSTVVNDALAGLVSGLSSGIAAFCIVLVLSIIYTYFTNEKLSYFIGILFGLGFLGFSGGLLAVAGIFPDRGLLASADASRGPRSFGPLRGGHRSSGTNSESEARLFDAQPLAHPALCEVRRIDRAH